MAENRYARWAQRVMSQAGRAQRTAIERTRQAPPEPAPAAAPPPATTYTIGNSLHHAPQSPVVRPWGAGQQQPPGQVMAPPPGMQRPPAKVLLMPAAPTVYLVKQDGQDPYSAMMANVPDMLPPSQYDAMAGQASPESIQALRMAAAGNVEHVVGQSIRNGRVVGGAQVTTAGMVAQIDGAMQEAPMAANSGELGSVAVPIIQMGPPDGTPVDQVAQPAPPVVHQQSAPAPAPAQQVDQPAAAAPAGSPQQLSLLGT